jgi:quinol monooxygenase YgiN
MVTVVAQYQVKAGQGGAVADALAPHIAATRAEPGCVTFVAYRASDDPDRFLLYEQYVDEDAFQAHRQTPHFATYVDGMIVPLLERRDWQRYDEVPPTVG